ncbi:hypothetical protein [Candidatus Protochlamydia amoebophila]|uniref:Uncharacterized protein n=1 Tax=Protochlamydia amoebophila (strain UWE25) TaxID=264201 RepID=Q6MC47_PARUW|nr:hypothetical protein [Candidatus Protochlamydia amoebophila]CAF23852.1 unnamed protein product [Candidatus Protochlamydia amoebophila UWE25]
MQFSTIFQHIDHLLLEAPKFLIKNEENKKTFAVFLTTLLQNPCLDNRLNLSPMIIGKITKNINHTKEFISYVQKSLNIAATNKLITNEDGLQSFNSLLKQIIKESIPLSFFEMLSDLSLSSTDMYEILDVWNDMHPQQFLELLKKYQNQIVKSHISSDQMISLLKKNSQIHPETLIAIIEHLKIDDPRHQIEIIRYLLAIYPEEMLYKIENIKTISSLQKLDCYLNAVSLYPRLISNWKAAFFAKTREELAKQSSFISILKTYDQIKMESEAEELVISKLESQWEKCFKEKESLSSLLSQCNFMNDFFYSRKELCIWLGFLLEHISKCNFSQKELAYVASIVPLIASSEHSLRYQLTAYLMEPEIIQKLLNQYPLNQPPSLFLMIYDLFKIPQDLYTSFQKRNHLVSLSTLLSLQLSTSYTTKTKNQLFGILQASATARFFLFNVYALRDLLSLQEPKLFENNCLSSLNLRELFFSIFNNYLRLKDLDLDDFFDHYIRTFGLFRIPEALIVYAKNLQNLPKAKEKKIILNSLKELVLDVFSGEYAKKRYQGNLSPHLHNLHKIDSNLMNLWQENQIKGLITDFLNASPRLTLEGCVLEETDQIEEIFICTTEVAGSCLSVRGNPEDNQSFLAIPLNGKNKIFCIKEKSGKNGKMIARAKLSFLIDDQENCVLLLDTLFSSLPYEESKTFSTPYEQMEKAIMTAAIQKAKKMNCSLVKTYSSSDQTYPTYPRPILSLGGRAPIECCNAVGALGEDELCQSSKFTISKTQILWSPD